MVVVRSPQLDSNGGFYVFGGLQEKQTPREGGLELKEAIRELPVRQRHRRGAAKRRDCRQPAYGLLMLLPGGAGGAGAVHSMKSVAP